MNSREVNAPFEGLLEYLKQNRGFDFTGYKRSSLMRRVRRRMDMVDVGSFEAYQDYLEVHPEEFPYLFNTILINVTSFFRDPEAWEYLAKEIIPDIIERKGEGKVIRIWSAGCASGEEAYSLVMLLAEAMGVNACRERVKVYATDVDEEALVEARQAGYSPEDVEAVPEPLRNKYFDLSGGRYTFNNDLRRVVVFGRHDLMQDAPISRLDLLVCRNTLIYFNAEAQQRILARFHFALNDDGCLFLGRAELLLTHAHLFEPVAMRHRVFAKRAHVDYRDRMLLLAQAGNDVVANHLATYVRLREAAFETSPVAQIVTDSQGDLALLNTRAQELFGLDDRDIGRPFQDLQLSYRPMDLRSMIDEVMRSRQTTTRSEVERYLPDGDVQCFEVRVIPLQGNGQAVIGISIVFVDTTESHRLAGEVRRSRQELETAYEELQSTNEELETTNEELQSSNEELQTTNEELQSTNEEMETMNEELHSTNAELQNMNAQLRERAAELDQVNSFLESILASVDTGVVVVDRDYRILLWNAQAYDLWGLRRDEVEGRSLFDLDIGLPVEALREPLQGLVEQDGEHGEVVLEARDRKGREIQCRVVYDVLCSRREGPCRGAVLVMEEVSDSAGAGKDRG
jgi:two-component system CheB/CheR fusion protein